MRASMRNTFVMFGASLVACMGWTRSANAQEPRNQPRELRTFVYPQSPNNTYKLPSYVLRPGQPTDLLRCGTKAVDGVRFDSDGRTFRLEPAPDRIKNTVVIRGLRVKRGPTQDCFSVDLRIVVPLLAEPDPGTWLVEWSPDRPDAIDVVVPSTELGSDPAVQAAHRLVFPWSSRVGNGQWVDCGASGCRWRVSADGAVRREFLTRATIPVKVDAAALTGLGRRGAAFSPKDGSRRPESKVVNLSKWRIKPDLSRRVTIQSEQKEVALTFPGAWAIRPTPSGQAGPQVVHAAAGPVLRFTDPNRIPPLPLTPGGGQFKAFVKLDITGQRRQFLNYVARFGSTRVRLPNGIKVCGAQPSSTIDVGGVPASTLPMPFIRGSATCRRPTGRVSVTLFAPVLRARDVTSVALDWSPAMPNTLDIYMRSRAIVKSAAIREDTELIVGDHPPGRWVGCFAEYCQYRIEDIAGAADLVTPTIGIRSKRMQAERSPMLDALTGLPLETQQVESIAWRVAEVEPIVGVPFLTGDRQATGTVNSPVARFFKPGPVACGATGGTCTIDPDQGAMAIRVTGREAIRISTISVPEVPLAASIALIHIRGEVWRPTKAKLRLKLSTCRYEVRQLSRAIAGLNEASILYRARLRPGSSQFCPGHDWSVRASTGERGHAHLENGLLEVYLEAIPKPGEGGTGTVGLAFSYPSGQKVRIDGGTKLDIEAAPVVGPPRVSVRLPGGDLRPLATTLAVNRPNILYFDMISDPVDWGVELVRARSLFRPCRDLVQEDLPGRDDDEQSVAVDFSDDESYGSYCIIPNERTNDSLRLRFVRQGPTKMLLRAGVDPATLAPEEQNRVRRIGWVEVDTARQAQPWSIAMDLAPITEMRCGDRSIPTSSGITPRAVDYDAFDNCEVRVNLGAPSRSGPPDSTPLEDTISFYGDQKIIVRARMVDSDDNSGLKVLATVRLRAENPDQDALVVPISLAEVGTKPPEDYAVVEVEVVHVPDFYAVDDKWSSPQSVARIRIRRGPEYLAWWGNSGRGARLFGAFTAVPFSLFRYPHSGKGVTTSDQLDELEKANVALGVTGILEAWNFDYNEAIIPVINPQLQIGALVSSNPTSGDLSLPGISLIAGVGLRTGVGTNPGKGVETSLKSVIWYEMLFQQDGRGNNPSHNILFGFTVDLGSTPN